MGILDLQIPIPHAQENVGGEKFCGLPAWARFFVQAGMECPEGPPGEALVTVFSVPHSGFAASLFALGYSTGNALPHTDIESYFEKFRGLPVGTALRIIDRDKCYSASFNGILNTKNGEVIHFVRKKKPGSTKNNGEIGYCIGKYDVNRITILRDEIFVPSNAIHSKRVRINAEFIKQILLPDIIKFNTFLNPVIPNILFISEYSKLKDELVDTPFSHAGQGNGESKIGCLQDLLVCSRIEGNSTNHRVIACSAKSESTPDEAVLNSIEVAIFDGSHTVIKFGNRINFKRQVIFLARTDPQYPIAVEQINNRYLRRTKSFNPFNGQAIPPGIEIVSFLEKNDD